ncbi:MAG: hypothetical protein ACLQGP_09020 [Isosphaeraceae bacterium]
MADVRASSKTILANIEKFVIGKRQEIILAMYAYFSEAAGPARGRGNQGVNPGNQRPGLSHGNKE